jgi:SEC-C motif
MAKVQRNRPCPCGSGQKAKRCCYGPIRFADVRVMPLDMTQEAVDALRHTSEVEMRAHFDQLAYLPEIDLSLQVPLPALVTPDLAQAISALRDKDVEEFDRVLERIVPTVDTEERRIDLARAVLALRDQGRISDALAAIAVMELDRKESILFKSSVAESLGVLAGDQRTPSGLLIATG